MSEPEAIAFLETWLGRMSDQGFGTDEALTSIAELLTIRPWNEAWAEPVKRRAAVDRILYAYAPMH